MPDDLAYWEWRDLLMRHPKGRAKGGEPCVKCAAPVPSNADWRHRDRHVCSPHCNLLLNRQLTRRMRSGSSTDLHGRELAGPVRMANPRTSGPREFRTLGTGEPPYEWEGFGVVAGDVVERYGVLVGYAVLHRESERDWPEWWPDHVLTAMELRSRHTAMWSADADGNMGKLCLGHAGPGEQLSNGPDFTSGGVACRWYLERVTACTPEGREFSWDAPVAAPIASEYKPGWWTPERNALSARRKRESSSTARNARRIREQVAAVERFDYLEVYERDGWICRLCGQPVDRKLTWPDPESPSLDHVVPLAAGGEHSRANTQLAHWICNVRKGARYTETGAPPGDQP